MDDFILETQGSAHMGKMIPGDLYNVLENHVIVEYHRFEFGLTQLIKGAKGLVVHGAMGCGQKSFKLGWRCHQLLFGLLAKGHLSRALFQSRLSPMS